jgi:hypothetical protein
MQLRALGWDYFLLGGELAAQYPGSCTRSRALEVLCSVLHAEQLVVSAHAAETTTHSHLNQRGLRITLLLSQVATDGADVLALLGPDEFVRKFEHTQVPPHPHPTRYDVMQRCWGACCGAGALPVPGFG